MLLSILLTVVQDFMDKLNNVAVDQDTYTPKRTIKIVDCNANTLKKPLVITRKVAAQDDKFD
jgi:hypothetical protein